MLNILFLNTPTTVNWARTNDDGTLTLNFTPLPEEEAIPVTLESSEPYDPVPVTPGIILPLNLPLINPARYEVVRPEGGEATIQPQTLADILAVSEAEIAPQNTAAASEAVTRDKYEAYRVSEKPPGYAHVPDALWDAFIASDHMEDVARRYMSLLDLPLWDSTVVTGTPPTLFPVEATEERMMNYDYASVVEKMLEKAQAPGKWHDSLMTRQETIELLRSLLKNLDEVIPEPKYGNTEEGYALATRYMGNGIMHSNLPRYFISSTQAYVERSIQDEVNAALAKQLIPNSYMPTLLREVRSDGEFMANVASYTRFLIGTNSSTGETWKPENSREERITVAWFENYLKQKVNTTMLSMGNLGRITSQYTVSREEDVQVQRPALNTLLNSSTTVKEPEIEKETPKVTNAADYTPKALNFPMEFPLPKPAIYSHVPDALYEAVANTRNIDRFDERAFEGLYGLFELPRWQVRTVHDQEPILERLEVDDDAMMGYDYNKVIDLRIQALERKGQYSREVRILRDVQSNIAKVQTDYEPTLNTSAPEAHNTAQRLVKNRHEQSLYDIYDLLKA